jgi:hypothetical protein
VARPRYVQRGEHGGIVVVLDDLDPGVVGAALDLVQRGGATELEKLGAALPPAAMSDSDPEQSPAAVAREPTARLLPRRAAVSGSSIHASCARLETSFGASSHAQMETIRLRINAQPRRRYCCGHG